MTFARGSGGIGSLGYGGVGGGGGGGDGGGGSALGGGAGGGGSLVAVDGLDVSKVAPTHRGDGLVTITALAPRTVASSAAHSTTGQAPVDPFAGDAIIHTDVGSRFESLAVTLSASANDVLSDPNSAKIGTTVN